MENMLLTDCMVDLETTGVTPDRSGILQIAAVKFNLNDRTVSPDFFNASLDLPAHRHWDMDTLAWWKKDKKAVLQDIMASAKPWRDVILEFNNWLYVTPNLKFWSKPTHFDYMFLASYFRDNNMLNPFHYNNCNDMKSFLEGIHYPNPVPKIEVETVGAAHNALNDCFWQLKTVFAHLDYIAEKNNV